MNETRIKIPSIYRDLFQPHRYKVYYGGRGSGKSTNIAIALLFKAMQEKIRVLCAREIQISIKDSVHRLLVDLITKFNLLSQFHITQDSIRSSSGSEFLFKGLHYNVQEIKSLEGVDICWIEEAQSVSADSWDMLIPTIRKPNSEIWITFNPVNDDDPTYVRFVTSPPDTAVVKKVNWQDNPYFPEVLEQERLYCLKHKPDDYDWIWEGQCRTISDAQIFKGKYELLEFTAPENVVYYHGLDWGFSQDPLAVVRCFVDDECLYIDDELYRKEVDFDELDEFLSNMPTLKQGWKIYGDSARPESNSFLKKLDYNIEGVDKWKGSVEDGIAYIRAFKRIYIHPSCKKTYEEFRRYSYKIDKRTGVILPVPEDKYNHGIDALRYALSKFIKAAEDVDYSAANKALEEIGFI